MAKIVSRARQLRLAYAAKIGRPVELREVAAAIGMTDAALSRFERGQTERVDYDTLRKLCTFYTEALERPIGVGDVLEYDPNNKRAFVQEPALQP